MDHASAYLVVNGRGELRLTKRRPRLTYDEVAFPVVVQIPEGWGCIYDQSPIELNLPPAPTISQPTLGQPEQDLDKEELE
jgi:hypothetical protein